MYTMVMMVAMSGSGDVASFGRSHGGCSGYAAASCCAPASYGCTGSYAAPVSYGCTGSSCHGSSRGGFLGLCHKKSHGCSGSSCYGSGYGSSCYGSGYGAGCMGSTYGAGYAPVVSTGCAGGIATGAPYGGPGMMMNQGMMMAPGAPAPVAMPAATPATPAPAPATTAPAPATTPAVPATPAPKKPAAVDE